MATTPVRVPEDSYQRLKDTAQKLDMSLSETAQIVLETGFDHLILDEYIDWDQDLQQEFQNTLPFQSEQEAMAKMEELNQRQIERNRERSTLRQTPR